MFEKAIADVLILNCTNRVDNCHATCCCACQCGAPAAAAAGVVAVIATAPAAKAAYVSITNALRLWFTHAFGCLLLRSWGCLGFNWGLSFFCMVFVLNSVTIDMFPPVDLLVASC